MRIAIAVALFAAVLALYAQCRTHELTGWDDGLYVKDNPHLRTGLTLDNVKWAFTHVHAYFWIPLTWISYMADVTLFGYSPGAIIVMNAVYHGLNAILLFVLLERMTASVWKSAAVAALFALHPLRVESVAWATERKDVLSTLFFLLTLLLFVGYTRTGSRARYALSLIALALGLMAKPMLVSAPFAILILDFWPLRRRLGRNILIEIVPFLVLAVAGAIVTLRTQAPGIASYPFSQRVMNAAVSVIRYCARFVWPANLSAIYPYATIGTAEFAGAVVIVAALTAAAMWGWRRRPFITAGWAWFAVTIAPVIGIVQVGPQAMADRFTYIPAIGLTWIIVWGTASLIRNRWACAILFALTAVSLTAATDHQIGYWRDGVTLFQHAVEATGGHARARELLGSELLTHRRYPEALSEFEKAAPDLQDDPGFHSRYAAALNELGRSEQAASEMETAMRLDPRLRDNPVQRAVLAAAKGNHEDAIRDYAEQLRQNENVPEAHNDLAAELALAGRDDEALREYETALRIDPAYYDARMNLAALQSRMGRNEDALANFQAAARLRADSIEPRVYLALIHAQMGNLASAAADARDAARVDSAGANMILTKALRMPPADDNLARWIAAVEAEAARRR